VHMPIPSLDNDFSHRATSKYILFSQVSLQVKDETQKALRLDDANGLREFMSIEC
jgi:hypothetical protein